MADIVNDRDVLIMATVPRFTPPTDRDMFLSPPVAIFKVSSGGIGAPASILFQATPLNMSGAVNWSWSDGLAPTVNGNELTLTYANFSAVTGTITAQITVDGVLYTKVASVAKLSDGSSGSTTYTWVKYADSAAGAGLSDDPTGKAYIGLAYNKGTPIESTTASDYTWSLIKGTDGQPGAKGADGTQLYTWIKYSDNADGTGLYDIPTASTMYIGLAVNKTTATESSVKTDYVWSKFKGEQGVAGPVTYTWIKYADSFSGAGLSDDPTGKAYIGFAYNKSTPVESTTASDYTWSLIKGTDGQPGGKGADGATLYTWIKYADSPDGAGMYDVPTASTLYIGISVNKTTATESTNPADYVWSKFKGDQGVPGPALYTWIKYADSAAGAGLSDDPTNKAYIGFAYNKLTAVESTDPADYTWSLNQGGQGVPGQPGKDGTTYYTWIKYADVADGTNLYDVPTGSTMYIGIAVNKTTATESTNKADYTWSKFRGDQGVPGNNGLQGQRGNVDISAVTNSSVWSDAEAVAALAAAGYGAPQVRDLVNLYKADRTFGMQKMYNGSAWVTVDYVYPGNVFVKGSILPESIDTRGLTIRDAQGNIILGAGVGLPAAYAAPGTLNSDLNPAISSAAQTALWTGVSGRPNTYRVIARGGSGTGNDLPEGMYINGVVRAYSASRSYNLIVIRRSDCAVVHALNYDVYGMGETAQGRTAYHLAEKLNSLSSDVIVVIYSADEPQLHRMEYGLPDAMYRCGASPAIFGSPQFKSRSAYILVGIPGVGTGGGAEAYQGDVDNDTGAWCDVGFNINSLGNIEMGQGVYKPTSLRDYSYVGDYDATKGATIGTNLYGQMNASNISTYIAGAAIDLALINKASITNLAALSAVIGLLRSATTGQRYELSDQGYQWFNAQNVAVIQIGNF